MKLKKDYPDIRCIAYCPPGGMVSDELAEYTKSFVLSVVIGDDIVPRLGVHSVHSLKADILKVYIIIYTKKYYYLLNIVYLRKFGRQMIPNTKFIGIILRAL
jgi:hypothetical protein